MGERAWTPAQLSAINTRDKTLLVSAAAGSGKTATLTERIIRSLTDPERPERITSLLVVTFTNAAATELRAKIAAALTDAVAKNPENRELERQLMLLPTATIGTIHSFCNDVVRANADKVGLPPNYRVADTAELELLEGAVIDGLVTSIYRGEMENISPRDLEELSDCLTNSRRTEDLGEILRYIYEKCTGSPEGVGILEKFISYYDPESFTSVEKTQHGSYLFKIFSEILDSAEETLGVCIRDLSDGGRTEERFAEVLRDDLDRIAELRGATAYTALRELLPVKLKTAPQRGKDPSAAVLAAIEARAILRSDLEEICEYFKYTEDEWRCLLVGLHRLLGTLYRLLSEFDAVYTEEKRRRGIISYGDMERYAYRILWQDGPTDTAKNLAARYTSVYIDEYQDVNSLQNRIFEAISREDNRFMVGDIKQSIYGFRRACPDIFADMKAAFPPLSESCGKSATIFMSNNFRCNRSVVDFVNGVFDRIFSLVGDSIGYEDGDKLCYSKLQKGGEPPYRRPELCLVPKGGITLADGEEPLTAPDVVARKIRALLDNDRLDSGDPVQPRDVAILLRTKGHDADYAAALARLGIPSVLSAEEQLFFHTPEVLLTLCLLNAIDNPRRDVYLAGLLCSPLFGFSADDLYLIQHGVGGSCLYDALVAYVTEHPDYERGVRFLTTLSHYRAIAEGMAVDSLIYRLYHETGLLSLAAASGGKNNLMLLYDYARGFASGSFKGLYSFISFVNNLSDKKSSFDEGREGESENAVTIVTCHHSKGLEYPIVFLGDAAARLGKTESSRIVYSEEMGAAMKLRTPSGLGIVENPIRDLIIKFEKSREYDEELRVLYVALTRARERLYIVGDAPTVKYDDYLAHLAARRDIMNAHLIRGLSSYFEMIYTSGEGLPDVSCESFLRDTTADPCCENGVEPTDFAEKCEVGVAGDADADGSCEGLAELLLERFSYRYPTPELTDLPEKMSVSKMTPTVLDEDDGIFELAEEDGRPVVPKFIDGTASDESAKRGIATHYFMQFCDLESLESLGTEAELRRLVDGGFISPADGERVRISEIDAFRRSSLFADMRSARHIWRELRFNTRLPATEFTAEESRRRALSDSDILVQGVIDCVIEDSEGDLRVIDYKTDRLSREERQDPTLAELTMRQKHENQLYYYSLAVERIFGKAPTRVEVYSLHLGDTVSVKRA